LLAQAGVPIALQFGLIALVTIPLTLHITTAMMPDDLVPIGNPPPRRRLPSLPPKVLLPLGLTIVCIALGEETINNWVALYLRDTLGASPAVGSAAYTAFAIATALGRLGGDGVIARLGVDRTLVSGSLLAAVGVGTGMAINQSWAIILGYTLMGLGLAVVVPVTYRRANRIPGVAPAQAVATVASIGFLGFLIGPLVIGAIADLTSLRVAIGAVAMVLLGISLLTWLNPAVPAPAPSTRFSRHRGEPA
jgi:MFS family permease